MIWAIKNLGLTLLGLCIWLAGFDISQSIDAHNAVLRQNTQLTANMVACHADGERNVAVLASAINASQLYTKWGK